MKKNRKWIAVILVILFVGMGIVCIILGGSPLDKFDFNGCTIGVYSYEGNEILEYLTEEQCNDFITILKNAELSIFGSSRYLEYTGGKFKSYKINLANGNVLDASAVPPYLVINDKGYKCDLYTLSKLNSFIDEVHKKYYPISK